MGIFVVLTFFVLAEKEHHPSLLYNSLQHQLDSSFVSNLKEPFSGASEMQLDYKRLSSVMHDVV